MSEYQVHIVDEWGRILRTIQIECDGDEQARALAQDPSGRTSTELWQGDRLIERYDYLWSVASPEPRLAPLNAAAADHSGWRGRRP
jgi:hypothetical protein